MGDSAAYNGKMKDSAGLEITGEVMFSIMIILFFTIVLAISLRLYLKCYFSNRRQYTVEPPVYRRQSRLFNFAANHQAPATRCSLDPSVLNSIPILTFSSKDEERECSVCLQEIVEGEKVRILPKCKHGFHVECIDMWFQSNSTCPLCRDSVSNQHKLKTEAQKPAIFPTNSFITDLLPSSSSSGTQNEILVVDIPRQIDEDEAAKLHVINQVKALKRLLSKSTTRIYPSSSSADPSEQC